MTPHSRHQLKRSSVFRDAQNDDSDDDTTHKLILTDPVIETSAVFRLYLELVWRDSLPIHRHLPHWKELVLFLNKWDCQPQLALLRHTLSTALQAKASISSLEAFIVAAMASDDDLCQLVLRLKRGAKWRTIKEGEGEHYEELHGRGTESLWDPRFWPAYFWTCGISHRYLYAVARSFGDHGTEEGLADGFRHYLAQISKRSARCGLGRRVELAEEASATWQRGPSFS